MGTACVKEKRVIMDRHHQRLVSVPHECFDLVLNHSEIITASAGCKNIHCILVKVISQGGVGGLSRSFSSTERNASLNAVVPWFGFDGTLQCHCA